MGSVGSRVPTVISESVLCLPSLPLYNGFVVKGKFVRRCLGARRFPNNSALDFRVVRTRVKGSGFSRLPPCHGVPFSNESVPVFASTLIRCDMDQPPLENCPVSSSSHTRPAEPFSQSLHLASCAIQRIRKWEGHAAGNLNQAHPRDARDD